MREFLKKVTSQEKTLRVIPLIPAVSAEKEVYGRQHDHHVIIPEGVFQDNIGVRFYTKRHEGRVPYRKIPLSTAWWELSQREVNGVGFAGIVDVDRATKRRESEVAGLADEVVVKEIAVYCTQLAANHYWDPPEMHDASMEEIMARQHKHAERLRSGKLTIEKMGVLAPLCELEMGETSEIAIASTFRTENGILIFERPSHPEIITDVIATFYQQLEAIKRAPFFMANDPTYDEEVESTEPTNVTALSGRIRRRRNKGKGKRR